MFARGSTALIKGDVSAAVGVKSLKVVRLNDGGAEWTTWISFSGILS